MIILNLVVAIVIVAGIATSGSDKDLIGQLAGNGDLGVSYMLPGGLIRTVAHADVLSFKYHGGATIHQAVI